MGSQISEEGFERPRRLLFIDAQDVIQLNFLDQNKKDGRHDYKVDDHQYLPFGKYCKRVFKELNKLGVEIVLLEHQQSLPETPETLTPSPLETLLKKWEKEGDCPPIAKKMVYSNKGTFKETLQKGTVFLFRSTVAASNFKLSTKFETILEIDESERTHHFVISDDANETIHTDYPRATSYNFDQATQKLVPAKSWSGEQFFLALKKSYLRLSQAQVFSRIARLGDIKSQPNRGFFADTTERSTLTDLLAQLSSMDNFNVETLGLFKNLMSNIKSGMFHDDAVVSSPLFKTTNKPPKILNQFDQLIPEFLATYKQKSKLIHLKSENLERRGFENASKEAERVYKKVTRRVDWFENLYGYENDPRLRLFGLLDCMGDCEKFLREASTGVLAYHRGWSEISLNILAFTAMIITVVPMIIYCCYYGYQKHQGNDYSFLFKLKTDSVKLLEDAAEFGSNLGMQPGG